MSTSNPSGFAEEPQVEFSSARPSEPRWLSKVELEAHGRTADSWLEAHAAEIDALETGTFVIINLVTGDHVVGATEEVALSSYAQRYGPKVHGFLHRVRRPITIGGGWWALHGVA